MSTDRELGFALSGGGLRAALFSLGALLYAVRCGANRRVRAISSVSGSSITNAVIALEHDFSQVRYEDFEATAGRLAARLCRRGSFFWPRPKLLAGLAIAYTTLLLAAALVAGEVAGDSAVVVTVVAVLLAASLIGLVVAVLYNRAVLQSLVIRHHLRQVASTRLLRWSPTLRDMKESRVDHVLCATDLQSGKPFLFSRSGIRNLRWGSARSDGTPLHKAVYSSAAFPGAIPPLRFRTRGLDFSGERPPASLRLVDGGVYNNLATDGFDGLAPIVVNGGSPPRKRSQWFLTLPRTMAVLYENTISPRLDLLAKDDRAVVLDIGAELPCKGWDALRRETSRLRTTLRPIGAEMGAKLLAHGYHVCRAGLHATHGYELDPDEGPDYFESLITANGR